MLGVSRALRNFLFNMITFPYQPASHASLARSRSHKQ